MKLEIPVSQWKADMLNKESLILSYLQQILPVESLETVTTDSWNAILKAQASNKTWCVKIINEVSVPVDWDNKELNLIGHNMEALRENSCEFIIPPIQIEPNVYYRRCGDYLLMIFPWCDLFQKKSISVSSRYWGEVVDATHSIHQAGFNIVDTLSVPKKSTFMSRFPRKFTPYQWASKQNSLWTQRTEIMGQYTNSYNCQMYINTLREKSNDLINRFPFFFSNSNERIQTLLHGDIRPENVLIVKNKLVLIYDFDFMRLGFQEEDVAYSALYYSNIDKGAAWFCGSNDWILCASYIERYQHRCQQLKTLSLSKEFLEAALYWTVLKEISLSIRVEEIEGRFRMLNQLEANMNGLLNHVFNSEQPEIKFNKSF